MTLHTFLLPLSQRAWDVIITSGQMFYFLTHLQRNAMMHIQQPKGCWNIRLKCAYRRITGIARWVMRMCTSSACRVQSEWVGIWVFSRVGGELHHLFQSDWNSSQIRQSRLGWFEFYSGEHLHYNACVYRKCQSVMLSQLRVGSKNLRQTKN